MITVLLLLGAGIVFGYFLREKPRIIKMNDKLITWAIFLLLFLLGINVGLNEKIIKNLSTIGVQSLILSVSAIAGSVILAWMLYKFLFKTKEE